MWGGLNDYTTGFHGDIVYHSCEAIYNLLLGIDTNSPLTAADASEERGG